MEVGQEQHFYIIPNQKKKEMKSLVSELFSAVANFLFQNKIAIIGNVAIKGFYSSEKVTSSWDFTWVVNLIHFSYY